MKLDAVFLGRVLKRLGLGSFGLAATEFLMKAEKPIEAEEDVFAKLERFSPDNGGSCITENEVDENPEYDIQVIMPVYNTEKTVRKAIESVLGQKGDMKVLLTIINDGSPDNSAAILQEYADRENVEVITQSNRGLSGARNRGMEHLRAKYVTFLDSDDWLTSDALDALYTMAVKEGSDIVQGSYIYFHEAGNETPTSLVRTSPRNGTMLGFPWGKLLRSSIFKRLCFPERYWFEDTIMAGMIFPLTDGSKKASVSTPVYYYRVNPNGITHAAHRKPKILDTIYVTRRIYQDREALGYPLRAEEYDSFLRQAIMNMRRVCQYGDKEMTRLAFAAMMELREKYFKDVQTDTPALRATHLALSTGKLNSFLVLAGLG